MSDQDEQGTDEPDAPKDVPDELPDDSEWAIRTAWWKDGGVREVLGGGGQQEQNLDQQQPADEPE